MLIRYITDKLAQHSAGAGKQYISVNKRVQGMRLATVKNHPLYPSFSYSKLFFRMIDLLSIIAMIRINYFQNQSKTKTT